MTERRARRLVWFASLVWGLFIVATVSFHLGTKPLHRVEGGLGALSWTLITSSFGIVAILVLARQPRNPIGWILMAIGLMFVEPLAPYGEFAISRGLPGGIVSIAIAGPLWAPPIGLMGTVLLLRFPNGELLSPRWRKVEWLAIIGILVTVFSILFDPRRLDEEGFPNFANPLGIDALEPVLSVSQAAILLIPATIVASAASLVIRFRRSTGIERAQMKWLTTAAAIVAVIYGAAILVSLVLDAPWGGTAPTPRWVAVIQDASVTSFVLIPISIGFAILKYRLYDIDVVINKALVYGAMAAFITAVYVAIVVGIGRSIGSERNLGLAIFATALVAVAFQPVRERVQRFANRLVYGKRATPYEVLSEFSGGVAQAVATEELLPRMAKVVAEGVGVARADVWLHVGSELIREATWPEGNGQQQAAVPFGPADDVASVPDANASVLVRHQGELLGVIAVKSSSGEAITPAKTKLLEDLASQAGLVLRNARLIEELRTSRQRLVTAQDEERRRLERDLHDGAQQRLVAISLALRMARGMVRPDSNPQLALRLDQASEQLALALSELREFARGIHPVILTERGLLPGLESLAERSTVPATVESSLDRRLPAPVEATAYFVVSEALANVGKYSNATAVTIRAEAPNRELTVEVADDGVGGADMARGSGLRGLADRVAALGGTLEIESPPGHGTTLSCSIPLPHHGLAEDVEESSDTAPNAMEKERVP
jgi:signal transduction histidine kinase